MICTFCCCIRLLGAKSSLARQMQPRALYTYALGTKDIRKLQRVSQLVDKETFSCAAIFFVYNTQAPGGTASWRLRLRLRLRGRADEGVSRLRRPGRLCQRQTQTYRSRDGVELVELVGRTAWRIITTTRYIFHGRLSMTRHINPDTNWKRRAEYRLSQLRV